jgi:hypothetical protein
MVSGDIFRTSSHDKTAGRVLSLSSVHNQQFNSNSSSWGEKKKLGGNLFFLVLQCSCYCINFRVGGKSNDPIEFFMHACREFA